MWNILRYLLGPEVGMMTMGDGRPDNSPSDLDALQRAYSEARAKRVASQSGSLSGPPAFDTPSPPISGFTPGWRDEDPTFTPKPTQSMPPVQGFGDAPWVPPLPQRRPASADAQPSIPLPQPRPTDAPQAQPDTSFFMRNALMQRDPTTNQFIDPAGASSVRGPDLINKMMAYLHNKDMG